MVKNLALEFPEEVKIYKIGTHCLRIAAQTISKAIGVSTSVRARQGQWSSARSLIDGSNGHDMAQLYGRNLREVLVEVQRYMSTAVFQTCESAGIQFKGHEQAPPSLIQSEAAVNDALAVRHKYLEWSTNSRQASPVEIDVQEDDEVLEDMEARFDASSTAAVQDFMEDSGFPIPESGTDMTIGGAWLCGGSPKPPQVPTAPAEKQKRIELFFQPRTTTDSDEAVEHDWVNYASWQRDAAGASQQQRCFTPLDDVTVDGSNSTWANSLLAKLIMGLPPTSPDAELSSEAQEMRDHSEISILVQRSNGKALQARVQPTKS